MKYFFWSTIALFFCSFMLQTSIVEKGKASYYSSKFEGKKTSSGEIFRQDSLTAAHKKLPFGTKVLVRNLKNDSTIVVRINDRLSQKSSHLIDLTLKAAKRLNFVKDGITSVSIEYKTK
ncbi:MAG: septal ring lytic transglycosylase RlpA family protein [Flavobacteriia bacterium]